MTNRNLSLSTRVEKQKNRFFVILRWMFFLLAIFIYSIQEEAHFNWRFIGLMVISILYNTVISSYIYVVTRKREEVKYFYAFLDIIIICALIYESGGVESDLFVVFFFILAYYGVKSKENIIIALGSFTVIFYTLVCLSNIIKTTTYNEMINLFSKDFILLLLSYGIYLIRIEVRKFDELHKIEFKLARTDKLTGLANRHYLEQKLIEEVDYCKYNNTNLNFLLFDIDNFKNFNDTYGHISGDEMLVLFSDIVKENIRKTDVAVRYGGEEFLILLRDIDTNSARNIADRIRRQLEKQSVDVEDKSYEVKVTVSCGLSQYPTDSNDITQVINLADKALYFAKNNGKNRVINYYEIVNKN